MQIKELSLINYRNYEKENLKFNNKINIIIGNNAQGKTNILESIYYLSITKSYRSNDDKNLILQGKSFFRINGKINDNKIIKKLSITYENNKKKATINNNNIRKLSDFVTNFNTIIISPEDIDIIKGTPSDRRNLLNIIISQISKKYIDLNNEFNKILKMRNDYLKLLYTNSFSDKRYFDIITDKFIEKAAEIYIERYKIIADINNILPKIYEDITGISELSLNYITNINIEKFEINEIKEILSNKLKENYNREINLGITLYGPHRDDFTFIINNTDLKYFGSQGQQKLATISLKLSLIEIYENLTNSKPVLLLDDVFSELDKTKKNNLIKYIQNAGQVIITANDLKDISKKLLVDSKIFEIKNKIIREKGDKNGK